MPERKDAGLKVTFFDPPKPIPPGDEQSGGGSGGGGDMYQLKTVNGYDLDVVMSAIQKAVRRGREREAIFWSEELIASNFVSYFWRRVVLIAHEECGADPDVAVFVGMAAQNAERASKGFKGRVEGIIEAHALLVLCRARKSREACDVMCVTRDARERGFRIDPHPVAIDKHTKQGKRAGRGRTFFREQGRLVAGPRGPNAYEVLAHGTEQPYLPRPEEPGGEADITVPPRPLKD